MASTSPFPSLMPIGSAKTLRLDFGRSFRYNVPVASVIADRLPVSIYYGLVTAFFTYVICIPLGILKAIRHRTTVDNATSVLIFVGYAIPGFALGAVLVNILAVRFRIFPLGGFQSADAASHAVYRPLERYHLAFGSAADRLSGRRLCRRNDADEKQPDGEYERRLCQNGFGKGLSWRRAVFVHALRNSLIPMATSIGGLLGIFLTGSVLIERVFNIQGIGLLAFEAIQTRDFPVVMGILVIASVC